VVLVVTDGGSAAPDETLIHADYMKLAGVGIVVVGVVPRGGAAHRELRQIASDSDDVDRLRADSRDQLHRSLVPLRAAVCTQSAPAACTPISPPSHYH